MAVMTISADGTVIRPIAPDRPVNFDFFHQKSETLSRSFGQYGDLFLYFFMYRDRPLHAAIILKIGIRSRGKSAGRIIIQNAVFRIFLDGQKKPDSWGLAHCDAALRLMVAVDHAGKLFERAESKEAPAQTGDIETTGPGQPLHQRVFARATAAISLRGLSAAHGEVSFVTFLLKEK